MRKLLLLSFLFIITTSCDRDECDVEPNLSVDENQLATDIAKIDAYLAENNIEAQQHPSGLRFSIIEKGDGDTPSLCGGVVVDYKLYLISDGTLVQESPRPLNFDLRSLITGWQVGIPLIDEGGTIHLYTPSVYAYGDQSVPDIPANSNLLFEIQLYVTN
jgi:FKBP-type peptidyl-prolyl cis-trans isomerase FkpA